MRELDLHILDLKEEQQHMEAPRDSRYPCITWDHPERGVLMSRSDRRMCSGTGGDTAYYWSRIRSGGYEDYHAFGLNISWQKDPVLK